MLLVLGNENCNRCEIVKGFLRNRNIEFEYKLLSDYEPEVRKQYISEARKKGIMQMPIILRNDEVIELSEV